MAVGLSLGEPHAVDEEARAEVDVLNSRLEKTSQLTKKIQASLIRLEASGQSVRDVAGPLNGETKRLQVLGNSESIAMLNLAYASRRLAKHWRVGANAHRWHRYRLGSLCD
jgi:hypothetical protein